MGQRETDWALDDLNRGTLILAALVTAIGGFLAVIGLSIAGAAVVAAGRRWYHRVDLPPSALARLKWEQAKAAANAGAGAWQETESAQYVPRRQQTSP